jgi:hypothetical protein
MDAAGANCSIRLFSCEIRAQRLVTTKGCCWPSLGQLGPAGLMERSRRNPILQAVGESARVRGVRRHMLHRISLAHPSGPTPTAILKKRAPLHVATPGAWV